MIYILLGPHQPLADLSVLALINDNMYYQIYYTEEDHLKPVTAQSRNLPVIEIDDYTFGGHGSIFFILQSRHLEWSCTK